jgi:hypothetical protein
MVAKTTTLCQTYNHLRSLG